MVSGDLVIFLVLREIWRHQLVPRLKSVKRRNNFGEMKQEHFRFSLRGAPRFVVNFPSSVDFR